MSQSKKRYLRELERLLPEGFRVDPGGDGHHPRVMRPDGTPARASDGMPLTLCGTPGDKRAFRNDLARLRREGLI